MFICTAGCSSGYDNANNGGIQESEDNDLDLSEADFAPAHCSVLLKPCTINGSKFDSPAFDTTIAKSNSTFPVCDEHLVMDGDGMLGSQTNMTSGNVQNTETNASASVHYDAIGLPLLTEDVVCYEETSCQNSVLSVQEAAFELSDNHPIKHDCDNGIMSSSNILQDDAVTADGVSSPFNSSSAYLASLSASDIQVPCEDSKVLDSCVGSDENTTCEKTDAVEASNANDENVASSVTSLAASRLECTDGIIHPSRQNVETINWDLGNAQTLTPVDKFSEIPVLSTDNVIMSEAVVEVQEEMALDSGDSCITQLITENLDEEDDGIDEVDKTVPSLCRVHHTTASMDRSFEERAPSCGHDHLLDDNKKPTDLASSESLWLEKECDETCGTDHVERITVGNASKSRVKVEVDSQIEVCSIDGHFFPAECRSESDLVINTHESKEASDITGRLTESVMCEMDNDDKDAVDNRVPMQSDVYFSLDASDPAASLPCSVSAVNTVGPDVIDSGLRRPEEIPTDMTDSMYDVSTANDQNKVDSLESLQKHVSEEVSISHISVEKLEVTDAIRPLSVNDAGDAVNAELHQKPLKQSKDDDCDSLRVVLSNSIAVDTQNIMTLEQAFPEAQLNGDMAVEKGEGLEAPSYTGSSVELDVQEVDLSTVRERGDEQQKSDLNNMPEQLDSSINAHCLPVDQAFDISAFNADVYNNVNAGTDVINKPKSVVYQRAETQTPSTDDMLVRDPEQRQSDEDAERWFEEQFAACEDFDVDEFVSSAWSAFHSDSEPVVSNIHDEMLEQTLAAASDSEPVQSDTADAWQYVENAAVSASAVDDSYEPSSSEYIENEMEPAAFYPPSSSQPGMTHTMLPVPGNFLITD